MGRSRQEPITAEVALYPLREPQLTPALTEFLTALRGAALRVTPGPMSTLIEGQAEEVFKALSAAFGEAAEAYEVVMRVVISNACPSGGGTAESGEPGVAGQGSREAAMLELSEAEHRDWLAAHAREVLAQLGVERGQVVLDFGCGPGKYCIPAAGLVGPEGTVYAVDKSEDALAAAAREPEGLGNVTTLNTGGGVALSVPDASCDLILMFDVLQLIDDWEALFSESLRILKPRGKLCIFPMHVDPAKVRAKTRAAGFSEQPAWRCVLNFRK
jgi:uncharacterized protein YqgV (UPF0045/DUF77 family)/protein-L-isoaspartate O-methyltransferase